MSPKRLLDWYDGCKRELPWRLTADPYRVWVSEIMLQQTTVAAVLPYYERWMNRFPSVEDLARCDEDDVLAIWAGLGYYSRCKRLLTGARWVVENGFPQTHREWLNVPGVGPYTAAAMASITLGAPTAVVDGNVKRVYARFNADAAVGTKLHGAAQDWANKVLDRDRPGDWNQAVMELGATVCRPRNPDCKLCPLRKHCTGFAEGTPDRYPIPQQKPLIVNLEHVILVPVHEGKCGILKTPDGEWWAGMWGFPRATAFETLEPYAGNGEVTDLGEFSHTVTQHRIRVVAKLAKCTAMHPSLTWESFESVLSKALPMPQKRALRLACSQLGISTG